MNTNCITIAIITHLLYVKNIIHNNELYTCIYKYARHKYANLIMLFPFYITGTHL